MELKFNRDNLKGFITEQEFETLMPDIEKAHDALEQKTGEGSEFTGWVDLPERITDSSIKEIQDFAKKIRNEADCLISIGIGGSYLGIRASIEFVNPEERFPVYFAGHNLNSDYLTRLLNSLHHKKIAVAVISKSGTTTEPALAFRIIRKFLKERYQPEQMKEKIFCITDAEKGALLNIAKKEGYKTFVIPDDIGGRFSVLTPVGLVPLAIAGVDIKRLIDGARFGQKKFSNKLFVKNIAYQYAAARFYLYTKGKIIEVLSSFYDNLFYVGEWWKQLFGESEGKEGEGIFPASTVMTTDLHSMGQFLQDGMRSIFETFLMIEEPKSRLLIPEDADNMDNFNCVADKDLDFVNKQAYLATAMAHFEGGVPNMTISIPKADEFSLGQLYYFFERAVAISGYLLGINPFNQPGVEAYKKKMFALLGRA